MHLQTFGEVVRALSILVQAVLIAVLFRKRIYRRFPLFTALMGVELVSAPLLTWIFSFSSSNEQSFEYWGFTAVDTTLQIAVVFEIAHRTMPLCARWGGRMRALFIGSGICGVIMAALSLLYLMSGSKLGQSEQWDMLLTLSSTYICVVLYLAMLFMSDYGLLIWDRHTITLAIGWGLLESSFALIDSCHGFLGWHWSDGAYEDAKLFAYLPVVTYWTIAHLFPNRNRVSSFVVSTDEILQRTA